MSKKSGNFGLIGLAGGFLESQASVLMIEINRDREALFVNISQLFFGIGAFAGPLLPVSAIRYGIDWKYAYLAAAILCAGNFIYMLFLDLSSFDYSALNIEKKSGNILMPVRLPNRSYLIMLIFIMFFYGCSETGLATWIPTFLRLDKSFSEIAAGQVFSFFWFATIAGRIIIGFLSRKIKILKLLALLIFLTIVSLIAGIYMLNNLMIIASFILSGLFMAGIWPLVVTAGGIKYPDKKNFVISVIILCGGIGGLSAPWLFSYMLKKSSLFVVMNAVYLFLMLSFIVSAFLYFLELRNPGANSKN